MLLLWGANIDLQYIGEHTMALDRYITSYITKSEKDSTKKLWDECNRSKTLKSRLKTFALKNLKSRECGIYEVVDKLLSYPLYEFSHKVTYLSTFPKNERRRMLKNKAQLEYLEPNSTNIYHPNFIDNYYPNRPQELENFSLFNFVTNYEIKKEACNPAKHQECYTLYNNFGYIHKRSVPRVLRIYDIKLNSVENIEKYYFQQLFLFKPWRQEEELILHSNNYRDAFNRTLFNSNEHKSNFDIINFKKFDAESKLHELARQKVIEIQQIIDNEIKSECHEGDLIKDQTQPLKEPRLGVLDYIDTIIDANVLDAQIKSLNFNQQRIFNKVISHIASYKKPKNCKLLSSTFDSNKPLRLFVSGVAGLLTGNVIFLT